jgi:hypothetical protein
MRFNRKTKMVHVFLDLQGGKIISIPWEKLFVNAPTEKRVPFIVSATNSQRTTKQCCKLSKSRIATDG